MKIAVLFSLYNEYKFIQDTINSYIKHTKYNCDLFINLSGPRFLEENLEALKNIKCSINVQENLNNHPTIGISQIIEKCYFQQNYDLLVCGSPDFIFTDKNAFDYFIDNSLESLQDKYFISCIPEEKSNLKYACGIVTKLGIEKIGYIDPNFIPMGMSDNDYHRRFLISYSPTQNIEYYNHVDNFINAPYAKNIVVEDTCHISYSKSRSHGIDYTNYIFKKNFDILNMDYYISKWGGEPGKEQFTIPFNKKNNNLKISINDINNGYQNNLRKIKNICSII